jgi:hypothetical protein
MGTYVKILNSNDDSIEFYTDNGINDFSSRRQDITLSSAVGGDGVVFDGGSMVWVNPLVLTSYIYVFDSFDGMGLTHYSVLDGTQYINGVEDSRTPPFTVGVNGITNVTGKLVKFISFDEVKSVEYVLLDYETESSSW